MNWRNRDIVFGTACFIRTHFLASRFLSLQMLFMKILIVLFAACLLCFASCLLVGDRTEGNGKAATATRDADNITKLELLGSIDVVVEQGSTRSVKINADENIIPHIVTSTEDGWLKIHTKDNETLHSKTPIRVTVTMPQLTALKLTGSGNIACGSPFTLSDKLSLNLTGSGNITALANTPGVEAVIKGSGNINTSGETKDVKVEIKGSGNYQGTGLKAENADVEISGSGDAEVFADVNLKASIRGSGNIKYKGKATVNKEIRGSGDVRPI